MRAAIFDFDGVLVDSEPLHFRALREALLPEGIHIDQAEYLARYLAYDDREALRGALEQHGQPCDLERLDALAARKAAAFERLLPEVPFFAGARALVVRLAARVPLAIASGALRAEIERILAAGAVRAGPRRLMRASTRRPRRG